MTRVFLAAGVAALAIAAPASAGPGGHGGNNNRQAQVVRQGGGGGGARIQRQAFAPRMQAPRMQRQSFAAAERPQRVERMAMRAQPRMAAREQVRANRAQPRVAARQQVRASHAQAQNRMAERQQARAIRTQQAHNARPNRAQQAQVRMAQRQQAHGNRAQAQNRMAQNRVTRQQGQAQNRVVQNRMAMRQQAQANRGNQVQNRMAQNQAARQQAQQNRMAMRQQQMQANRLNGAQNQMAMRQQANRAQNLLVQRRGLSPDRIAATDAFRNSRMANFTVSRRSNVQIVDPVQAVRFVGQPVSTVTNYVPLAALPASVSYLYPNTPDYYYQYGGGYLYQVDRSTSLIDALIPLLAGGFMPGTYLPQPYMSSYVPSYYGLNSFYPSSFNYGYGYGDTCNRYANGVVYQVDCVTGMVENVVPLYAGGYGVGQMLPSAYGYYNVPMQYRSMYYPTADYSYWYAPGAIYQYNPSTSLITSVAALMSPGFTVGQPLPAGYGMYNVPLAYRSTYYDTPDAWYRYNNGYIYQINPATQLVTSVVASLLT
jgi:hypothetical protein